jgi:hypothetical protein
MVNILEIIFSHASYISEEIRLYSWNKVKVFVLLRAVKAYGGVEA